MDVTGTPAGRASWAEEASPVTMDRNIPPQQALTDIDAPPMPAEAPTAAMLKADIDSGATGDKVEGFDPGMAMLGTCEEAGGNSLTPAQLALARREERKMRWLAGARKLGYPHGHGNPALYGFVGFIALVAVVVIGAIVVT